MQRVLAALSRAATVGAPAVLAAAAGAELSRHASQFLVGAALLPRCFGLAVGAAGEGSADDRESASAQAEARRIACKTRKNSNQLLESNQTHFSLLSAAAAAPRGTSLSGS